MRGASRGAVAALGLALAGWPMAALGQTVITPDIAAGRGLGTTVGQAGTVYTVDGGTRAGNNLFHSFSQFDLGAGDTARWARAAGDGASIANVVNRVTGGAPSTISGALDSTALPNAAFWFVNPAGIVFGAGAAVNVPGAAHFSTAAELRFADGARFSAATPSGSTLSIAAPEAFGFLGAQGDIDITGAGLGFAPGNATLSFSAANVSVTGSQFAPRGLDLVAVGDKATAVRPSDPLSAARGGVVSLERSQLAVITTDAPGAPARVAAGEIRMRSASLVSDTGGAGRGGDVVLQGDRMTLAPDAFVISSTRGAGDGGQLVVRATTLEVDARGATTTTGFGAVGSAGGAAGGVSLTATDTISLLGETDNPTGSGYAFVGSTIIGAGDGGDVELTAGRLVIDTGLISSSGVGTGRSGDIRISAPVQDLGNATVLTGALGDGRPGDVRIDGATIAISGGAFGATPGTRQQSGSLVIAATERLTAEGGGFTSSSSSPASFGSVTLTAPQMLLSQSRIGTEAFGEGLAGQILLQADTLLLDRIFLTSDAANGASATGLVRLKASGDLVMNQGQYSASVLGTANGGRIEVSGRDVLIDGAIIQTDTAGFGTGDAGQIAITADNRLDITTAAFISSSSGSEGDAGDIALKARAITMDFSSGVHSDTLFAGNAGRVTVDAQTLDITDGASITSEARTGTGEAGTVTVNVGKLSMANGFISSSTSTPGRGGSVAIKADQIDLDGSAGEFTTYISSETFGAGDGGNVTVQAKSIALRNGGQIASNGYDEGAAGSISISADDLTLTGGGAISSAGQVAEGGDVSITAGKVTLRSEPGLFSYIVSSVFGAGDAGNLTLDVRGALELDGGSSISSDNLSGSGNAGAVRIKADSIAVHDFSGISSSTNDFGNAGTVGIQARTLTLDSGGIILSVATSRSNGNAGAVTIDADTVTVGKDSSITTATFASGNAGAVDITATKALSVDGGEISSSSGIGAAGAARSVTIATGDLTVTNAGLITTLSDNAIRAGEVNIVARQVTVDGFTSLISSANTSEVGGDAGTISITADG
ncbi:MAG: filamentous hemagglutinin N-terminal domain-containing protein, partial [Phenylobacterium sp.]|nr:filamentous hemagglutinin N-terminal domain-containing protein [Phenylobacterium sp.]